MFDCNQYFVVTGHMQKILKGLVFIC